MPSNDTVLSMEPRESNGGAGAEEVRPVFQRDRGSNMLRSTSLSKDAAVAVTPYRSGQRGANPSWCAYCRSDTHSLRDCVYQPPRGACWDCKRTGCRRGKPGCPGKGKVSAPEQNWRRTNPDRAGHPTTLQNQKGQREVRFPTVHNTEVQGTAEERLESQTEEQ